MDYEDLVTIQAFLAALRQAQPLPDEIQQELEAIAPSKFPVPSFRRSREDRALS